MINILIADDEPIEREVVAKIIENNFGDIAHVYAAPNGRVALELFEEHHPEILVLDICMPGIGGLDAAEQIRQSNDDCQIIFLTAFDEFEYAKKAISVRALEYLLKPTKAPELVAVLEKAISVVTSDDSSKDAAINNSEIVDENDHSKMNVIAGIMADYIANHYQEDLSLQQVAQKMNYSDAYFSKVFKHCFDKGFIVYLNEFRIEKAKELLSDISVNIKDVSERVGYRDSNYFAKVFKRMEGMTPSEYRIKVLGKS